MAMERLRLASRAPLPSPNASFSDEGIRCRKEDDAAAVATAAAAAAAYDAQNACALRTEK